VRTLKTFKCTHILGASRGLLCDSYAVLYDFPIENFIEVCYDPVSALCCVEFTVCDCTEVGITFHTCQWNDDLSYEGKLLVTLWDDSCVISHHDILLCWCQSQVNYEKTQFDYRWLQMWRTLYTKSFLVVSVELSHFSNLHVIYICGFAFIVRQVLFGTETNVSAV